MYSLPCLTHTHTRWSHPLFSIFTYSFLIIQNSYSSLLYKILLQEVFLINSKSLICILIVHCYYDTFCHLLLLFSLKIVCSSTVKDCLAQGLRQSEYIKLSSSSDYKVVK